MSLARLEKAFWRDIRSAKPPHDLAARYVAASGSELLRRVGIYHHAYYERQHLVLAELFPRLRAALRPAPFREIAIACIRSRPSGTPIIERIGAELPPFLETLATRRARHGALATQPRAQWLALVDLSRLEWARTESLLAPDSPRLLTPEALASADLERARLSAVPSLRLLRVRRRAVELWSEESSPVSSAAPPDSDASAALVHVVVTRHRGALVQQVLAPATGRALSVLLRGGTMARACAEFRGADAVDQASRALTEFFRLELWSDVQA